MNDFDDECPSGCGGFPRWGCNCVDDGEQYRVPRTQYPDGDRVKRPRASARTKGPRRA